MAGPAGLAQPIRQVEYQDPGRICRGSGPRRRGGKPFLRSAVDHKASRPQRRYQASRRPFASPAIIPITNPISRRRATGSPPHQADGRVGSINTQRVRVGPGHRRTPYFDSFPPPTNPLAKIRLPTGIPKKVPRGKACCFSRSLTWAPISEQDAKFISQLPAVNCPGPKRRSGRHKREGVTVIAKGWAQMMR